MNQSIAALPVEEETLIRTDACLRVLMAAAHEVVRDVTPAEHVPVSMLIGKLSEKLRACARPDAPLRSRKEQQQHALVEDALRFIEIHHQHASLTLGDVARHVCITPSHLDRLLRIHTGVSFGAHRTMARLKRASQLLVSTRLSVKEVSAACGYNYVSTFDRVFVRVFRCTPTAWRERGLARLPQTSPVSAASPPAPTRQL
jgi:transcriptional regulator GlxA family with amidase domain